MLLGFRAALTSDLFFGLVSKQGIFSILIFLDWRVWLAFATLAVTSL